MRKTICILLVLSATLPAWAGPHSDLAMDWLKKGLQDRQKMMAVLTALRSTEDPALLPVFAALGQNKDENIRRVAPALIMQLAGESRAAQLLKPMVDDSQPSIRSEVLVYLNSLDAVDVEMLKKAIAVPDERLQCLAARSLVRIGHGPMALQTLQELVKSIDPATSAMARMALLSMGASEHAKPLAELVANKKTANGVLMLLLEEARELKISAAVELVDTIAQDEDRPLRVRSHAYKTLATIAEDGQRRLTRGIVTASQPMPVYLLIILSQTDGAEAHLKTLAGRTDMVGTLARFELARKGDAAQLSRLAAAAIELEHPIAVNYVLERAIEDIENNSKSVAGYEKPVLDLLETFSQARRISRNQLDLVSNASRVVGDIGSKKGLAKLKEMANHRFSPFVGALAAGLIQVSNPDVSKVAISLLDSPYKELSMSAAFALGRQRNQAAVKRLTEIVRNEDRYRPALVALASWYLLKIENAETSSVQKLAELVR